MDAKNTQETGGTLRVRLGVEPRTFQKAWKRTFGYSFESGRIVTDSEREAMEGRYMATQPKPALKPKATRETKPAVKERPAEIQAEKQPLTAEREKAYVAAKWEFMKRAHKERMALAKKSSEIYTIKKAPLWLTLALTAGASVPNMFQVTFAIKHDALISCFLTGALTVAPFLLIMSKVRGFFPMAVVLSVMLYTGFCNATSIFGGLTALDVGYVLKPTVFLEAVTNLLNTDYLNTARGLSGLMALLIGAIEFVSFKNIAK